MSLNSAASMAAPMAVAAEGVASMRASINGGKAARAASLQPIQPQSLLLPFPFVPRRLPKRASLLGSPAMVSVPQASKGKRNKAGKQQRTSTIQDCSAAEAAERAAEAAAADSLVGASADLSPAVNYSTNSTFASTAEPSPPQFNSSATVGGSFTVVSPDGKVSNIIAEQESLSIIIVGASGDLAKKKIFPALFALFYEGYMPKNFTIVGFARSKMSDEELREMISLNLTCRIDKRESCGEATEEFLKHVYYQQGLYNSIESFQSLDQNLRAHEGAGRRANRIFYMSIPPSVFLAVAQSASTAASSTSGWTRVIVEKPFGRDLESSMELSRGLGAYFTEDQLFRIDHYLGKELIENLTVLRFSNLVFEPLWNRQYIRSVQVIFTENFGTEGRGGYFDQYGIIRDIMQNHLIQIVSLFGMEQPVSLDAEDIRNEKVKVLRNIFPVRVEDLVLGQYRGWNAGGKKLPGYLDDDTVPPDSVTPTFAACAMFINNPRWDGVPFLLKAGKALSQRKAEIRIQFRHVPGQLYKSRFGADMDRCTNELVIRVQPQEGIYLMINNKVPGLGLKLQRTVLNLNYQEAYNKEIPDSYERLILDVINGDKRLFIRNDELEEAWKIFSPLLHTIDKQKMVPELYPYGSRGPIGAHYLAAKYKIRWGDDDETPSF